MANQASDEQLMHWYQNGNVEAFDTLYRRYKNSVYHYFFRQVDSTAAADELHQDVWLNIIKSSSAFSRRASFKTWLYTIAHNRLVDHYRRNSKQPLQLVQDNDDHSLEQTIADTPPSQPEEMIQQQQIGDALLQGIDDLPEAQKEVFLLYENAGLSLDEIAGISDSSYESTKSRLRYAVKKLRQHMADSLGVKI